VAASSVGQWPRVLRIVRNRAWTLSSAWVVESTRRMAGGNAKNGMTCGQARRHDANDGRKPAAPGALREGKFPTLSRTLKTQRKIEKTLRSSSVAPFLL